MPANSKPHCETWLKAIRSVAVIAMPIGISFLVLIIVGKNAADEPYGVFGWEDAALQVGGPAIVVVLWIVWAVLFWSLPRRNVPFGLAMMVWACLTSYAVCELALGYFSEPWALNAGPN